MTAYGSLFERLGGIPDQRSKLSRDDAVRASLVAHLAKMLSTRAGSVTTLPDYGMPDLNDMSLSLHDAQSAARAAIAHFIETYEPRLTDVEIHSQENTESALRQAFTIGGRINVNGISEFVSFNANLKSGGEVTVT